MTDERFRVLRVAALPAEYDTAQRGRLFEVGYEAWCGDDSDDVDTQALIDTVETVGRRALSAVGEDDPAPLVDVFSRPSSLVVGVSLAGVYLCDLDRFADARPTSIQPVAALRRLYATTMVAMLADRVDDGIRRDVGEVLLGKPPADHVAPYAGPTVTAIVDGTTLDVDRPVTADRYLEIPIVAASPDCLVEAPHEDDGVSHSPTRAGHDRREYRTLVTENHLYVPVQTIDRRYRTYLAERGFPAILDAQQETLDTTQREWLQARATAIRAAVDRLARHGHRNRLWTYVSRGDAFVTALERAIMAAPPHVPGGVGERMTAGELYDAIAAHDPEEPWVDAVLDDVGSSRSLAHYLSRHEDHSRLRIHEGSSQRQYVVNPSEDGGSATPLSVDHPEDFFQLPCYQALDERLRENGPTRKELWDLVRKTAWLPQYRSNGSPDTERILSDIKDLFSRWPWYDPTITEQQVRYELRDETRHHLDGTEPLPMGCENQDMQQYCIGKDQCEYSIYGSVPFAEELYETLENDTDESSRR